MDTTIEDSIEKLCSTIKLHYCNAYSKNANKEVWPQKYQEALHDFVLSRDGWERALSTEDIFYYKKKLPIRVNILYTGSTSMLMIVTAINIAKAELIYDYTPSTQEKLEELIKIITEAVKTQDWMIAFSR